MGTLVAYVPCHLVPGSFWIQCGMAELCIGLESAPLEGSLPPLVVRPWESCLGSLPIIRGDRSNSDCLSLCVDKGLIFSSAVMMLTPSAPPHNWSINKSFLRTQLPVPVRTIEGKETLLQVGRLERSLDVADEVPCCPVLSLPPNQVYPALWSAVVASQCERYAAHCWWTLELHLP